MARSAVVALVLVFALGTQAAWQNVNPNAMTVLFGASAPGPDGNTVYTSGGDNGGAGAILKSTDGGLTLSSLPHDLQLMYLSIDIAKGDTAGAAGALGFYGATAAGSFSSDGESFFAFGENVLFSASQSCVAVGNNTAFLVGFFMDTLVNGTIVNGIAYTNDAGNTFAYSNWHLPETTPRYGAISNSAWILTGGSWPTSKTEQAEPNYMPLSQNWGIKYGDEKSKSLELVNKMFTKRDVKNADDYWGNIAISTDQGNSWTEVFYDIGSFYFNGISCVGDSCWAVAEGPSSGYIYESRDGGFSWSLNAEIPSVSLMDIEFYSATSGWAVGGRIYENTFDALFLHTSDSGATWVEDPTIPNAYPNGVSATADGKAYASAFMRNGLSSLLAYTP